MTIFPYLPLPLRERMQGEGGVLLCLYLPFCGIARNASNDVATLVLILLPLGDTRDKTPRVEGKSGRE